MPGFDRTGPMGAGSMTGGARGLCNPANAGYNARFTQGSNYGRGLGLRRGFRGGYGPDTGVADAVSAEVTNCIRPRLSQPIQQVHLMR
jgi:hypothetical protein